MAKAPIDIRSLARSHTRTALNTLASIMNDTNAPAAARKGAADSLLDRGWGKAAQIIEGNPDAPHKLIVEILDPTKPKDSE